MTTTPTPAPAPPETPKISVFGRLTGVLFSPKETFADIARSPSWIVPVALLTVMSLCLITLFTQRVGWERFMRQQFEQNPRMAEMSAEQRQQALDRAVPIARTFGYVQSAIGPCIFAAILGGIMLGAYNLIGGAGASYMQSLAIVAHSFLPGAISGTLGIIIILIKDPDDVDLQNLVGSNVGALLSSDAPKWLSTLCGSLDIFSFWIMFLIATGFSAANPKKLSLGKAFGIVGGLWAFLTFVRVAWAAM